jgi:glucose-1-phosphate thymidylyltransferase
VIYNESGEVSEVQVKREDASSIWVWGAMIFTARAFTEVYQLWEARHRADEYLGDLLNAYIGAGNSVHASPVGETYIDVGTIGGYHRAQDFLRGVQSKSAAGLRLVG